MYEDEYGSKEKDMEVFGTRLSFRMTREHHCPKAVTGTPMGKRKVGRPKTTWCRTAEKESTIAGWKSWEEARALAKDRSKWKSSVALCATEREEDR